MRVTVIINPVSGPRARRDAGAARADEARRALGARGLHPAIALTERPGHARDLAREAVASGSDLVIAWGGDGTVNEVGSALVGTGVALGVVPAGSGNGLANEFHVPRNPAAALARAADSPVRAIDVGEIAGRIFLNVAGLGVDARIARRFEARRGRSHGLRTYVRETVAELRRFTPAHYVLELPAERIETRAMLVCVANSPQYGNGARIAPGARPDDGKLDLVVVEATGVLSALWRARRLFTGTVLRDPAVRHRSIETLVVCGDGPILFHVDGEASEGPRRLEVRVRPGALLVAA